ncbi:MAG TPA: glutathione S-transferase family protein [Candidatus Binatia bacterium]|jgi:glutathione S-transferase|nr:glutathione S-transferase family protein [Candidatus Binatia bacterium]
MMSDDVTIRLHYFPFPGRGGAIRDALRMGGVPFEDVHVPLDRFRELKSDLPFGSLPVLDVETSGGLVRAAQSNAILRFVGRRTGLYPIDDPLRALKVDEALDLGEEFYRLIGSSIGEQDAGQRMAMRKVLAVETLPRWGGYFDRLLVANGRTGFVVGDALTVADLKLHWIIDKLTNGSLDGIPTSVLDAFAEVTAWRKNVAAVREARLT